MADKKKEVLSLDPFDVLSEVVTGEIFDAKRFSGLALPEVDTGKEVNENDGTAKRNKSDDGGSSGRNIIRNPFKPSTEQAKTGKAEERRATAGNGSEQSDKDKSSDESDKSDKE